MTAVSKRAFTSARHAQRRALNAACRDLIRGKKWRSSQGVLFAERGAWFVAVAEMTNVLREETSARLIVKPMVADPVFWDLVGEPQLRMQPLSFRYFGALACPGLILGEPEISEEGGVPAIARRLLELGEATLQEVAGWTVDEFLGRIAADVNPPRLMPTTVATLVASGRMAEALALCEEAVARREIGGFLSRGGSFPEKAAGWIRASVAAA